MGERIFSSEPLPTTIRGVSCRLMAACSANNDCFLQFIRHASHQVLITFCIRAFSTDSAEMAFSEVNASIGYKGTAQKLFLHLRRIDIRTYIKQNPLYLFTLCKMITIFMTLLFLTTLHAWSRSPSRLQRWPEGGSKE